MLKYHRFRPLYIVAFMETTKHIEGGEIPDPNDPRLLQDMLIY